ncbi:MAG: FG-GAP-like repeat-containing protein [Rubricoccaceae bacterium]|nr:FG-GAP-like repeat-containing protein [Rubricoccaceae bacterium]
MPVRYALLAALLLGAPAAAQPNFTDVTEGDLLSTVVSWGASWVDYDGDGDPDLFVSRQSTTGGNALFRNDDGTFTLADAGALTDASTPGSLGHTWADYDNDGDLDVYTVGGWISGAGHLFRNDGGTFVVVDEAPVAPADDNRGWSAAWGDYDADGLVDLVVAHPAGFVGASQLNHLFHNEGGGAFARVTDGPIVTDFDPYTVPSWSDYDLDGDLDLFIGSGPANGVTIAPDNLYENDGTGTFTRITTDPIATDPRDGQVMNWVDYDNDGDLDLYVTNYAGKPTNDLYRNDGGGVYTAITDSPLVTDTGGFGLANTWGDLDNDGDLDLFVTTGGGGLDRLYTNEGGGVFTRVEDQPPAADATTTSGATLGDYDDDGDLDLAVTSQASTGPGTRLYRNDLANGNAWVKVRLRGRDSNRSALGAIVRATATINGASRTQLREVSAQNTFNGQNSLTVHVGLGDATTVDELEITWPSGQVDTHAGLAVNATYNAVEGQGIAPVAAEPGAPEEAATTLSPAAPNPFTHTTTLRYTLAAPAAVRLTVTDVLGRTIAVLVDGEQPAGAHAVRLDAADLPSGLYLVRLTHPGGTNAQAITLAR